MPIPVNRPRQLLKVADFLRESGTQPVTAAIEAAARQEAVQQQRVVDRLTLLVLRLPTQVKFQAVDVLAEMSQKYVQQVDRVIGHFAGRALAGGCNDWVSVFDEPATLAISALGDLIDFHLQLQPVPSGQLSDLVSTVEDLIAQIKDAADLNAETRSYLLEVAFQLLQVLQRFDLFGVEGVIELQGQFVATLINFHSDDFAQSNDGEETTTGRRFIRGLWDATEKAVILTGLPANAFAITQMTNLALHHGSH